MLCSWSLDKAVQIQLKCKNFIAQTVFTYLRPILATSATWMLVSYAWGIFLRKSNAKLWILDILIYEVKVTKNAIASDKKLKNWARFMHLHAWFRYCCRLNNHGSKCFSILLPICRPNWGASGEIVLQMASSLWWRKFQRRRLSC